jgi:NhaP-type Na+/H+ or K+/H+ antiporter
MDRPARRRVGVGPPGDEDEREPNFALTSEAGLNDGLAFPFVFLGAYIAAEAGTEWVWEWLAADVAVAVPAGQAIGAAGGWPDVASAGARLLLVVRPLATEVAFASGLGARERAFIGWLGVRGIGALYYAVVAIGLGIMPAADEATVLWTVAACAVASIVVHGVTATPLSRRLLAS